MKKQMAFFLAMLFGAAPVVFSQIKSGTWELSLSGYMGSESSKIETTTSAGKFSADGDQKYLKLSLRSGYYLVTGLALEPEILWFAAEGIKPGISLSGNLAYNLGVSQAPVALFGLIGFGKANGTPFVQDLILRTSDKFDVDVLNLGAGAKFFLAKSVAFRTEYRFQRYHAENSVRFGSLSGKQTRTTQAHNILLGLSVFL